MAAARKPAKKRKKRDYHTAGLDLWHLANNLIALSEVNIILGSPLLSTRFERASIVSHRYGGGIKRKEVYPSDMLSAMRKKVPALKELAY